MQSYFFLYLFTNRCSYGTLCDLNTNLTRCDIQDGVSKELGETWQEECNIYTCTKTGVLCTKHVCDCSKTHDKVCCRHCFGKQTCKHQVIFFTINIKQP